MGDFNSILFLKLKDLLTRSILINLFIVGLGGLGVTCSSRDSRFVGSNLAEVDGFFQDIKS